MAYYLSWAKSAAPDDADLNQARIFLPIGAGSLYLLATNEHTLPAVRTLVKRGEPIDQRDNEKLDALALALSQHDTATARRLIALGARPDALVSAGDIPAAFIPVLMNDKAGVRLMQQSGVDYASLRVRGRTAFELAQRSGHPDMADLLDNKARPL